MVEIQTLTANAERMWSNRNLNSLLVGIQNGTATLKDSLVFWVFFFYKTRHTLLLLLLLSRFSHVRLCATP